MHSLDSDLPYAYNDAVAPGHGARESSVAERFAAAFAGAQHVVSIRSRTGWVWHLRELFKDDSAEHMRVVDAFLQPILEEAIAKNRAAKGQGAIAAKKGEEDEDETLLDHLVKITDGVCGFASLQIRLADVSAPDPVVLHDETLNILIAGRDTVCALLYLWSNSELRYFIDGGYIDLCCVPHEPLPRSLQAAPG